MTEEDAQDWIRERFGAADHARLALFARLVVTENGQQNLIAASTTSAIWARHVVDSAQLVPLAPLGGLWLDVGTGAGFPGLVAAILRDSPTLLVEPRRRRAAFLTDAVTLLDLGNVEISACKVEQLTRPAAVISARAVAPLEKLLPAAAGCATIATRWLLPRGRLDPHELTTLKQHWSGEFHVKQSLTDPASAVLVLDRISSKDRRP